MDAIRDSLRPKNMIFQREHCKPIAAPSQRKLALELSRSDKSFASITATDGSYLQVAGGPGLFLLEHRQADGKHYRAFQEKPIVPFPDGTLFPTSAGTFTMQGSDWFLLDQVVSAFSAFGASEALPEKIQWRELSQNYVAQK
jgi:hypothetical protein